MIKPALLLLLLAVTITVSQRRSGRDPPQADNTGSWEGDAVCTDERSCREFWRDVGLSYAEYYATRGLGRIPSRHRHGSSQDRRADSSDSSSSSSSSSEESSHRGRRSVESQEDNYSDDNDDNKGNVMYIADEGYPGVKSEEYNYSDDNDDNKDNDMYVEDEGHPVIHIDFTLNASNHRNIRSVFHHKNRKHGGFGVTDLSSHETGNGMPGRDLTRPGYWRIKANRKYPLWLKRKGSYTQTPGTGAFFERIKASLRKPCTKHSQWLSLCKWKQTSEPAVRRLPSTSSGTSEPHAQFTSTPADWQTTQSTSVPAQERSSVSTSGPAQERSSVSTSGPAQERSSVSTSGPAQERSSVSTSGPAQERSSVSTSGPTEEPSTTQFVIRPVLT